MTSHPLVVATQLPSAFQQPIASRFPQVRFEPVQAGVPSSLPRGASVLFAAPCRDGATLAASRRDWIGQLAWIQLLSSGIDSYPAWYFEAPRVSSARGPTSQPVAEFALAAVFAHAKQFPSTWIHTAQQWEQRPLARVAGATLGIVGYGAIGRNLARMAAALGMRVLVHRRRPATTEPGVEFCSLQDLLARSDHLVLAAAATAETRHLVNAGTLARVKPSLHLVNVSRGTLVDQDALLRALDDGKLAAATLDVTDPEPLPAGHPLYTHPRVRLSPHVSSRDAQLGEEIVALFCANLRCFLAGEPLANLVDISQGY